LQQHVVQNQNDNKKEYEKLPFSKVMLSDELQYPMCPDNVPTEINDDNAKTRYVITWLIL
jgi:hypothetical protein